MVSILIFYVTRTTGWTIFWYCTTLACFSCCCLWLVCRFTSIISLDFFIGSSSARVWWYVRVVCNLFVIVFLYKVLLCYLDFFVVVCADVIVNLNVFFLVVGRYDLFIVSNSLIRNSDENSYFGHYCPGNARFDVRNFFACSILFLRRTFDNHFCC